MNKKELRAEARFLRFFNNPGLKSGVIDNELIMDFSPKPELLKFRLKVYIIKNSEVFLLIPDNHVF
jgi:hypothetical protein